MNSIPILVQNDPWLEPLTEAIRGRMRYFEDTLAHIKHNCGSLAAYATRHKSIGIHYRARENRWHVREWAAGAKAMHLIGDFNGWNPTSHPLTPTPAGVWELALDGEGC